MTKSTLTQEKLLESGIGAFFRPRDVESLGVSYYELRQFVEEGSVERVTRGLYRLTDAEPSENHSLAAVCAHVPTAIICLLSALRYHDIGTQLPREIWIAIPRAARTPRLPGYPIRLMRFSGPSLSYGVESIRLEDVPARITSPARTVVDCFRYRRKIGLDVALEALRDALHSRHATVDEIVRAAEVCRARTVIRPYLESIVS